MTELLMKFAVFLLAAVVVVPIAKMLKLGSVLGYLAAGVLIGPYLLGYLGVGDRQALMHISEFGVVMMLFLIGMELKPSFLWRLRVHILGMGGAQMVLTTVVLAGLVMLLGQAWQPALVIGMILALSSTAIIVQTMSEKGLLETRAGRSTFSVLLMQDISVIPILAIMPLLANRALHSNVDTEHMPPIQAWLLQQQGYVQFLAICMAIVLVIVVGRFASGQLFRLIAKMRMRDIFTATALFLVVSVALLMEMVGLSAALGTFLAGVMLSESEYRHEIELSIEPFKELLLGMFFISVGASLNIELLLQSPLLMLGLAVGYIGVKWLILYLLARSFKLNNRNGLLFACLLAQGGEFAFVLFGVAANQYILEEGLIATLTLIVTLSMMITPIIMLVYDRLARKSQSQENVKEMDELTQFEAPAEVIIAGYGRFNQIVGRLLKVNGYSATILDNNPQVISLLKRFGQKVFYGDVTRPDLLYAAGAEKAKVLIIGIRDRDQIDTLVKVARKHFPHLRIMVRAFDRVHAYHLMDLNVDYFKREQLDSALELGEKVLVELGYHPYSARRQARIFKDHDEEMLRSLYPIWSEEPHKNRSQKPGDKYISHTRELNAAFEEVLRNDRYNRELTIKDDHAWEPIPSESFNDAYTSKEQTDATSTDEDQHSAFTDSMQITDNDGVVTRIDDVKKENNTASEQVLTEQDTPASEPSDSKD